ncbi:MAG: MATE family efflux transporter [Bacillota bacterium]|nr:MATE family efflux transporter [Bacillota bacterium]
MQNNATRMGEESITKLLIRFSVPATISMLVTATYNIVDTIFVGRLGIEAIAALSVAFPFQMLLGALGIGTGVGAASLISRSLGANQKDVARKAIGQVITLSVIYGIIIAVVGWFYLDPILVLFGATPEIIGLAGDYMVVITTGSVMFFLIMSLNNVVRGEGNPRFSMNVMIATALINIILDPIFIFVLGLGVQGAAVATVLAKIIGVILILHYFITGRGEIKVNLKCLKLNYENIRKIYVIGFPVMIMQVSTNVSLIIANNILGAYGYLPIAALGLIFRLIMFALMPVIGISQGLLPIIGYNFGAQKMQRIREAMVKGLLLSVGVVTFFGVIYFSWPALFLSIFTDDRELIALGTGAMRIMVFMFPLIGAQVVFTTYFQAAGRGLPSLLLSILRDVLLFIPLLLILSGLFGLDGVWYSRPLSDLVAFLITYFLIYRELKRQGIPLAGVKLTAEKS